jgi:putative transcription factor
MSHQDWTPVVFHRTHVQVKQQKQLTKTKQPKFNSANSNKQNIDASRLDNQEEPQRIKKVTTDLKMNIQKARCDKEMTQKQLAQKCNLSLSRISEYESGRAVPNNQEMQKIGRALGLTLSNKKRKSSK